MSLSAGDTFTQVENIISNTLANTLLFEDHLANYSGRTNIFL